MLKYILTGEGKNPSFPDRFDLLIREFTNGAWLIFSMILLLFFMYYLWDEWRRRPIDGLFSVFRRTPRIEVAAAMLVIFLGETVRAGWVYLILKRSNDGLPVSFLSTLWPVGVFAAVTVALGSLYAIRVFTRQRMGYKGWLTALGVAILFLGLAEFW